MNHHQSAIAVARAELARMPVFLDTETTGMGVNDQIVEICVLDHDGSLLFESLVKPTWTISPAAQRVHGISPQMVQSAPPWYEVWSETRKALAGRRVGIYNAQFDLNMMRQSHQAHGLRWSAADCDAFCIMDLYAQFYGKRGAGYGSFRWQSLDAAGRQCRISLPNSHRAQADARLARAVLKYMADSKI